MSNIEVNEEESEIISLSTPKLSAIEKLYVRAYLSTLDHVKAHKIVAPTLKSHHSDNTFSRKANVQFHISVGMQEAMESLSLTPEVIISKLYKEATREGGGSNHAARVTALSLLGKEFGLFKERKEDTAPIINIVHYSNDPLAITVTSGDTVSKTVDTKELELATQEDEDL
jgi:hypothetical protein